MISAFSSSEIKAPSTFGISARYLQILALAIICISYLLFIPYAEFRSDDVQMISALKIIVSGEGWPLFWKGWYPIPHGIIAAYIYLPLYFIWPSVYAPFVMNALLNTGTCSLLFAIGTKLGSRKAGILAAALFFLNPAFFGFWAQTILQTTPILFLNALGVFFILRYFNGRSLFDGSVAFLAFALGAQCHLLGYLNFIPFVFLLQAFPVAHLFIFYLITFACSLPLLLVACEVNQIPYIIALAGSTALFPIGLGVRAGLQKPFLRQWSPHFCVLFLLAFYSMKGAPVIEVFRNFLEMLDSSHSYNLIGISSPLLTALRRLPQIERIIWMVSAGYLLLRFNHLTLRLQLVSLVSLFPLIVYMTFGAWMQPQMILGHSHLSFLFPQHYILVAWGVMQLYSVYPRLASLLGSLVLLINVSALLIFTFHVSRQGRPNFNRPMLEEQFEAFRVIGEHIPCAKIRYLIGDFPNEYESRKKSFLTVAQQYSTAPGDRRCAVERLFYVRIKNTIGDLPVQKEVLLSRHAHIIYSSGRLEIFESEKDIEIGLRIFPQEKSCLPVLGKIGFMPGIVPTC